LTSALDGYDAGNGGSDPIKYRAENRKQEYYPVIFEFERLYRKKNHCIVKVTYSGRIVSDYLARLFVVSSTPGECLGNS
jgi:hypothetical protein